jgi:hypothetical protein
LEYFGGQKLTRRLFSIRDSGREVMLKIIKFIVKSFTFWLSIISIGIIIRNILGWDDKNYLLGLLYLLNPMKDPRLALFVNTNSYEEVYKDSLLFYIPLGIVLDLTRLMLNKLLRCKNK